jgi:hypothetical protein
MSRKGGVISMANERPTVTGVGVGKTEYTFNVTLSNGTTDTVSQSLWYAVHDRIMAQTPHLLEGDVMPAWTIVYYEVILEDHLDTYMVSEDFHEYQ